jgi:hypothetical protein
MPRWLLRRRLLLLWGHRQSQLQRPGDPHILPSSIRPLAVRQQALQRGLLLRAVVRCRLLWAGLLRTRHTLGVRLLLLLLWG